MQLAEAHEPLVLADGTVIDPNTGTAKKPAPTYVEVPTHRDAQAIVVATRRKIADLPDVPQRLNALSVVLMYTMLGLHEREIAIALNITEDQVARMKMLDAYDQLYNDLLSSINENELLDVRTYLTRHARTAAKRIIDFSQQTEDPALAFGAAKDILDRSGNRPVDVVEHRMRLEGGLTIVHVKKTEGRDDNMIDITPDGEF